MEYNRDRSYNFPVGGNSGMVDGYLSDVPTNQSLSPSEASHDFIQSQRVLERNFKDKYRLLKSTYEKRLRHLSETVAESCQAMMNDELLNEMKLDKTSSAFIPAHLSELVDRHLENSREKYLHQMVSKVTQLEAELLKSKESIVSHHQKVSKMEVELIRGRRAEMLIEPMQTKILSLEKDNQNLLRQSTEEIEALKFTISDVDRSREIVAQKLDKALHDLVVITKECDQLRSTLNDQNKHVTRLEESFEQSARDIKVIEEVERQDRQFKQELKDQLNRLVEERNRLVDENADCKSRASIAESEVNRLQTLLLAQGKEQEKSEQKFSSLMQKVEAMLAQEANESNAAISTVHDKMKQLKHKLTMELQREKRISQTLQDELFSLKSMKDGQATELARTCQERDDFKERLNIEIEKSARLSLRVQETNNIELDCRSKIKESEFRMRQAEQKLLEFQNLKNQEMKIFESRIQLEVEKSFESERFHLDTRGAAHRLKYQNELGALQSSIRNSINGELYSGVDPNGFQQQMLFQNMLNQNLNNNHNYNGHQTNNELYSSFEDYAPNQRLKFKGGNNRDFDQTSRNETNIALLRSELEDKYEDMITKADDHIEELKKRLRESQVTVELHQNTIDELRKSLAGAKSSLVSVASTLPTAISGSAVKTTKSHRYLENDNNRNSLNSSDEFRSFSKKDSDSADVEVYAARISKLHTESNIYKDRAETLEGELQRAKKMLADCKNQAIQDQTSDSQKFEEMKKKFASLMSLYQQQQIEYQRASNAANPLPAAHQDVIGNVRRSFEVKPQSRHQPHNRSSSSLNSSVASNTGGLSRDRKLSFELDYKEESLSVGVQGRHDDILLYDKLSTLENANGKLEIDLRQQTEVTRIAQQQAALEREKSLNLQRNLFKVQEAMTNLEMSYRQQLRGLKQSCIGIRNDMESLGGTITVEFKKIMRDVQIKSQDILHKVEDNNQKKYAKMRIDLTNALDAERIRIEDSYGNQIQEQLQTHNLELKQLEMNLVSKADRVLGLTNAVVDPFVSGNLTSSSSAPVYEFITKSMLESFVANQIIGKETSAKILVMAESALSGDMAAFHVIENTKTALSEDLTNFGRGTATHHFNNRRDNTNIESVSVHSSVNDMLHISSTSINSARQLDTSLLGELHQAKSENAMLMELSRLEAANEIGTLKSKIVELERLHQVEIAKLKSEKIDVEKKLRLSLEEELAVNKAKELDRIVDLESRLEEELDLRMALQAKYNNLDTLYRTAIEEFDRKSILLAQRADHAELELTKLKMELLLSESQNENSDVGDDVGEVNCQ